MGEIDSESQEVAHLTIDSGIDAELTNGSTYSTQHTFYVFHNPYTIDKIGTTWNPRRTRLVVECDYNGRTCYYPVTLPQKIGTDRGVLTGNKCYHITLLTLTRPGSTSPEDPDQEVSSEIDVTVKIEVADWENETAYTETF